MTVIFFAPAVEIKQIYVCTGDRGQLKTVMPGSNYEPNRRLSRTFLARDLVFSEQILIILIKKRIPNFFSIEIIFN